MERHYIVLAQILPDDERLDITYDRELELINVTTYEGMIHSDTAMKLYAYCAENSLRCYISVNYITEQICLGILKNI